MEDCTFWKPARESSPNLGVVRAEAILNVKASAKTTKNVVVVDAMPWNVGVVAVCFDRGDAALEPPVGSSRSAPLLKSQVSATAPSFVQRSRMSNNARQTDRRLRALVVNVSVGDREVGARRVGGPAELASNNHALNGPRGIREQSTWNGVGFSPQGNCR